MKIEVEIRIENENRKKNCCDIVVTSADTY